MLPDRVLCPTSFKSQSKMLAVTFLLMYVAIHFKNGGVRKKKPVIITPQKPSWPPSPHLLSLGALNSSQDKLFYPKRTSSGLQWGNNKLAQESMERPPPHQGPYDLWNLRTCLQKRLYRCFLWGHLQWDNVGVREAYPGYPFRVCRTREAWMCHQEMASSHLFWAKIDCLS